MALRCSLFGIMNVGGGSEMPHHAKGHSRRAIDAFWRAYGDKMVVVEIKKFDFASGTSYERDKRERRVIL